MRFRTLLALLAVTALLTPAPGRAASLVIEQRAQTGWDRFWPSPWLNLTVVKIIDGTAATVQVSASIRPHYDQDSPCDDIDVVVPADDFISDGRTFAQLDTVLPTCGPVLARWTPNEFGALSVAWGSEPPPNAGTSGTSADGSVERCGGSYCSSAGAAASLASDDRMSMRATVNGRYFEHRGSLRSVTRARL